MLQVREPVVPGAQSFCVWEPDQGWQARAGLHPTLLGPDLGPLGSAPPSPTEPHLVAVLATAALIQQPGRDCWDGAGGWQVEGVGPGGTWFMRGRGRG